MVPDENGRNVDEGEGGGGGGGGDFIFKKCKRSLHFLLARH